MPGRTKVSPRSLDAIVLIAKNYKKQVSFYRDTLGLEVVAEYGDAIFFSIGKQKLAIFAKTHHPEAVQRLDGARHGISHLEFGIKKQDVDAIFKRLTDAGAAAYDDNFEDADGNLFHFNW
jgi:catechol-2,3-dioxygenase